MGPGWRGRGEQERKLCYMRRVSYSCQSSHKYDTIPPAQPSIGLMNRVCFDQFVKRAYPSTVGAPLTILAPFSYRALHAYPGWGVPALIGSAKILGQSPASSSSTHLLPLIPLSNSTLFTPTSLLKNELPL